MKNRKRYATINLENESYHGEERLVTCEHQKDNWFVVSGKYNGIIS